MGSKGMTNCQTRGLSLCCKQLGCKVVCAAVNRELTGPCVVDGIAPTLLV